jgi:hypothetical protein
MPPSRTNRTTSDSARRGASRASAGTTGATYWELSRRPLHVLLFLLPLIMAYEVGMAMVLRTETNITTIRAHGWLLRFFELVGIAPTGGLFLGGLAIVIVLLCWHFINRDPLRVRPVTLAGMAVESVLLTLPLLVMAALVARSHMLPAAGAGAGPASTSGGNALASAEAIADLSIWSKMTISVGAGLYEELVFRMLLIAAIHFLLVDLGKASHFAGGLVAIVVSAALFTVYHPLEDVTGEFSMRAAVFYFAAGLYFGAVFVSRGFGIVVAVHALYDIATIALLQGGDG